jgi:AraC-like DNA-binding protein
VEFLNIMENDKPTLEQINPFVEASIYIRAFEHPSQNQYKFWHYHRETEILYVNKGSGKRYAGSHFSYFNSGQLIMVGPFLPHYTFIDPQVSGQVKYSIQMREGFPGVSMLMLPEMQPVKKLLERAVYGIAFSREIKLKVGKKIEKLMEYKSLDQFIRFLEILKDLAEAEDYQILNTAEFQVEIIPQDYERLNKIFNFVRENFKRQISLDEAADKASMTSPSFARYFKKVTGKTFTHFVNEYRLVHASKLLAEAAESVTDVCFESGFNNFSHFNKQFKAYSGKSPTEYRKEMKQVKSR